MPTIVLLGAQSAGKSTVGDYLVSEEGFTRVRIRSTRRHIFEEERQDPRCLYFETASEFLDHATLHWRERFVTSGIRSRKELDPFVKRPWVLLVGCEAGVGWRWRRRNEFAQQTGLPEVSLEDFIHEDDLEMFGSTEASTSKEAMATMQTPVKKKKSSMQTLHIPHGDTASTLNLPTVPPPSPDLSRRASYSGSACPSLSSPLAPLLRMCNLHIQTSSFGNLEDLKAHLKELDLTKEDRMRPGWDRYFMTLAGLASLRSNCMKRRVGAVLVSNKRVISTGYNGTPRGMRNCNEGGCARCNSTSVTAGLSSGTNGISGSATPIKSGVGLDQCLCLHAEENALLEAGRDRVEGGVIYCNTCPCLLCAVKICQTGVREVCYSQAYSMDDMSANIFKEAGVLMRQINLE